MNDRADLLIRANTTLRRAYGKHGYEKWGRHEFYGILKEEVDELWEVIKLDGPTDHLVAEMSDIVGVLLRYYETGNRYGDNL